MSLISYFLIWAMNFVNILLELIDVVLLKKRTTGIQKKCIDPLTQDFCYHLGGSLDDTRGRKKLIKWHEVFITRPPFWWKVVKINPLNNIEVTMKRLALHKTPLKITNRVIVT